MSIVRIPLQHRRRATTIAGRNRRPLSKALTGVIALALAAAPVHADSPKLAQARRAVEAVDYEAAQRLLLDALGEGGNSPAALGEIYRLSARAAIVLDQRDVAEQYYRRWLAIDPAASLPADTAPKLREPFVAAQSYVAAHGRLVARALRTSTGDIDVELVSDPLAMAHAAILLDTDADPATSPAASRPPASPAASGPPASLAASGPPASPAASGPPASLAASGPPASPAANAPAVFGADRRAHLPAAPGSRVAILDESGNHLLVLEAIPATRTFEAVSVPPSAAFASDTPPWTQRWTTWAVPTGAFGLVSLGFGIAALASYGRAAQITDASGQYFLSDAEANVRRGRTFVWITAGAGAVTLACAIPTAIYFLRDRDRRRARTAILPTGGDHHVSLIIIGSF